jgi:P27 family predicted phage terminase small subunit
VSNPAVPTRLKVLRGNPSKRSLGSEPEPEVPIHVPDAPEYLDEGAQREWHRIAPQLHAIGLLTVADLDALACYVTALSRWITAEQTLQAQALLDPATHGLTVRGSTGSPVQNPIVKVAERAARDVIRYAGEFGLTPAARARLAAGSRSSNNKQSKFAGLLASG